MKAEEHNPLELGPISAKRIDINRLFLVVMSLWYIPTLVILLCLAIAYVDLRYTQPMFSASLTLKFDDEKGAQLNDIFRYGKVSGRLDNVLRTESEVLKSRNMAIKTMNNMGMLTQSFIIGDVMTSRIYPNPYFNCVITYLDSTDIGRSFLFKFDKEGNIILMKDRKSASDKTILNNEVFRIGRSKIKIEILNLKVLQSIDGLLINTRISNISNEAFAMSQGLTVDVEKNTNIINLSYNSDNPNLAADYLNNLAETYINEVLQTKTLAAQQTINYIDKQLVQFSKNVRGAQVDLADFIAANKGVKPDDISKAQFSRLINLESQKSIINLRKKQFDELEKSIKNLQAKTIELAVLEENDNLNLSELIDKLNTLIMERISAGFKNKENSPIMLENERKISELKRSIYRAIQLKKTDLQITTNSIDNQIQSITTELGQLPSKEQTLLNLERDYKVNEKIYGYLLERRLESLLTISAITSNVSTLDKAIINHHPFSPIPERSYLIALLIGLGLGTLLIFIIRYTNNKINDKEGIERISSTPVIGIIKKLKNNEIKDDYIIQVLIEPKSIFSESIRGIRTNLNFILKGDEHKLICVTSTVSGEGKTFCTMNVAASLTLLGKKVLIIGCDLRRPKIHLSFQNITNDKGLTTYLINKHVITEVIQETEFQNLYVLPAGPSPPNPSELIQSEKFTELLKTLRNEYDFIFLDTAPIGLVADSFPLLAMADINLFILRAQYSKREFAQIPDRLILESKVKPTYTVLNAFDHSDATYSSIYYSDEGVHYGGSYYMYGNYYGARSYYGRKYYSNYYADYEHRRFGTLRKKLKKLVNRFKS